MPDICVTKRCSNCKITMALSGFHKNRARSDGFANYCKECAADNQRQWAKKNPDKLKENWRQWSVNNPGRVAERQKRFRNRNPSMATEMSRIQRKLYPERVKARKAVYYAVKVGKLKKPTCCSECGRTARIYGHHEDYDKQLDVIWLCARCHQFKHV